MTAVHPIEAESYRIIESRVDLSRWEPLSRAVVARVIHAAADISYADTLVLSEGDVAAGVEALRAGAPVVSDVEMVRVATARCRTQCFLDEARGVHRDPGVTLSAAAMQIAAARYPVGAVVVVGNAPTALVEAVRLDWEPALVIGLPVGFVGAAESKEALRASGRPSISNVGERGGSAVAAAALNAIARLADAS